MGETRPGNAQISASALRSIEDHISVQTSTMGIMERINNTPLPFAFVAHLRSFLLLYLLGLPFAGIESEWVGAVIVIVIAFSFLGIEAAAVACERPFGLGTNHLPLDLFIQTICKNVL